MVAIEERSDGSDNVSVFDAIKVRKIISPDGTVSGNIDIRGDLIITSGSNIQPSSSGSGTKIGTSTGQKIGLWGVTPIVQPIAATGGAMTVDQLLVILQTTGIVKQS